MYCQHLNGVHPSISCGCYNSVCYGYNFPLHILRTMSLILENNKVCYIQSIEIIVLHNHEGGRMWVQTRMVWRYCLLTWAWY